MKIHKYRLRVRQQSEVRRLFHQFGFHLNAFLPINPLSSSPKTISAIKYTRFHIPFNAVKEERLQFCAAG